MLDWLTHAGQASAAAGYVPLPSQIQQLARTILQQVAGPSGTQLPGGAENDPGPVRASRAPLAGAGLGRLGRLT